MVAAVHPARLVNRAAPMDESQSLQAAPACASLQLSQLTIRRFRCLHDIGPLPIQEALTVLAGENGGGKTTCIDAIAFLLGVGKQAIDDDDRSHWAADDEAVEVEGSFCALDDSECQSPLRLRARQDAAGVRSWEILDQVHSGFGARPADLPLPDLRAQMQRLGIPSPGGQTKPPYVDGANAWLVDRPPHEFEASWRPVTKEEQTRLPTFARFDSVAAPSPTATIQQIIQRECRQLLEGEPYAAQLAALGAALDADFQPRLQHFKNTISEHCGELDSVEVKTHVDFSKPALRIQLEVHRQGEAVDLEKEGEGQRRRIALAIHEADLHMMEAEQEPSATLLLAYDEPDLHLDYAAQRKISEILERQARVRHVQVVVATHSHKFIDRVTLPALLHFRLDAERQSHAEVFTGNGHSAELGYLSTVLTGLGLRTSTLLDERCFLVIEGDTEGAALPQLFQLLTGQSLVTAGIILVNTRGHRSVRRFVDMLATEWKRDVILLADADARGEHEAWVTSLGLQDGDGAYYIGSSEFEDVFSDEAWLRALQASFSPANGQPWTLGELAELRLKDGKYSYHLCSLVKRRCCDSAIGKPDLGFALAAVCTPADIPPLLQTCLLRAREVAQRLRE
jgi:putative ATP-dependent endonuclease of the OLD family